MAIWTSRRTARRTATGTGIVLVIAAAFAFGATTADGSALSADNVNLSRSTSRAGSPASATTAPIARTSTTVGTPASTTAAPPKPTATIAVTSTTVAPPKPTAEMAPPPTAPRRTAIVQPVPSSSTTVVASPKPPAAVTSPPSAPATSPNAGAAQPPSATTSGNRLIIDRFGFNKRIVNDAWSQASIDRGNVVLWNGCWPGGGCPVWLAGHRSSHGSVFARMIDLQTGDIITVVRNGTPYRYRIYGRQLVSRTNPPGDAIQGDLIIQTSWTNGRVWMIYANAI